MLQDVLFDGVWIVLADGTVVTPEQVVGPNQAGRKVVILGQTSTPMAALKWAQGADSVVFSPSLQVCECCHVLTRHSSCCTRHWSCLM